MHRTTIKVVNAQQAKLQNIFKNTKLKLLKTNAAIWFNKMCKTKQLTPKYFDIKINGNSIQTRNTRLAATRYRINRELNSYIVENKGQQKIVPHSLRMYKILECYVAVYANNY